ncbi:MAG TPA: carboxylesterase/lipase family protein [Polyangiales bacterium]
MASTAWTEQGKIEGEPASAHVSVFRGVPYAQPPVGHLRLRAPVKIGAWSGTRDARRFGPASPQDVGLMQDLGELSEDCLYLNVWTPAADGAARPVMVWIHGGGFSVGSGGQELYDGAALAERGNLVVVTINYRLGALGFGFFNDLLGGSSDVASNNGMRDQIAALRWVRDNIGNFGGDPQNVTVFGESAGAMSIGSLLAAPEARGLFRRAIAQSGAAHHATTREQASRMAELVLHGVGASASHPERLWNASAAEIVAAQRACWKETILRGPVGRRLPQGSMTLVPVQDDDFLPAPFESVVAGSARGVDLMVGANLDEWNYFLFLVEPKKREIDEAALLKICNKRLEGRAAEAIDLYRSVLGPALPAWKIYCAIEGDRMFRIPALRLAEAQSGCHPNTFMYSFEWPSPLFGGEMGACHAIEIPFAFGTVEGPFGRAFSGGGPEAARLSRYTLDAWASFARTGDPSHERLGRWERFDRQRRTTMRLGATCIAEADPLRRLRPFWESVQ